MQNHREFRQGENSFVQLLVNSSLLMVEFMVSGEKEGEGGWLTEIWFDFIDKLVWDIWNERKKKNKKTLRKGQTKGDRFDYILAPNWAWVVVIVNVVVGGMTTVPSRARCCSRCSGLLVMFVVTLMAGLVAAVGESPVSCSCCPLDPAEPLSALSAKHSLVSTLGVTWLSRLKQSSWCSWSLVPSWLTIKDVSCSDFMGGSGGNDGGMGSSEHGWTLLITFNSILLAVAATGILRTCGGVGAELVEQNVWWLAVSRPYLVGTLPYWLR